MVVKIVYFVEIGDIIASARIHGKGRIQLPAIVRRKLNVMDGDLIIFIEDSLGNIVIKSGRRKRRIYL